MQFFVYREDRPDSVELRMQTRPAHLQYAETLGDKLIFAGPTMDGEGNMIASVWVIEAENQAEAEAITAADPYEQVDLFKSKIIQPFVKTAGWDLVRN